MRQGSSINPLDRRRSLEPPPLRRYLFCLTAGTVVGGLGQCCHWTHSDRIFAPYRPCPPTRSALLSFFYLFLPLNPSTDSSCFCMPLCASPPMLPLLQQAPPTTFPQRTLFLFTPLIFHQERNSLTNCWRCSMRPSGADAARSRCVWSRPPVSTPSSSRFLLLLFVQFNFLIFCLPPLPNDPARLSAGRARTFWAEHGRAAVHPLRLAGGSQPPDPLCLSVSECLSRQICGGTTRWLHVCSKGPHSPVPSISFPLLPLPLSLSPPSPSSSPLSLFLLLLLPLSDLKIFLQVLVVACLFRLCVYACLVCMFVCLYVSYAVCRPATRCTLVPSVSSLLITSPRFFFDEDTLPCPLILSISLWRIPSHALSICLSLY